MNSIIFFLLLYHLSIQKTQTKNDNQISEILSWANKSNIYINENLILNKNKDSSHDFYYFTSNSKIKNGTVLLRIPYNIMISKNTILEELKKIKNKKFIKIWNQIENSKRHILQNYNRKQLLYLSIIIENAITRKKGIIYNKYKSYFDMYEYIDMDKFPLFFDDKESYFLSVSNFGSELMKAKESLKDEYNIIYNRLNLTSVIFDSFLKSRILTFANCMNFKNKNNNVTYNETIVVPFIDCFNKVISLNLASATHSIGRDKFNNYYFEITSIRDINKGEEINLHWKTISNQESYLFYGFIEPGNKISPNYYLNVFNDVFKGDLGIEPDKKYDDIAQRDLYELNSEFLQPDIIKSYKNISQTLDKYKNKKEGCFEMMADNFQYYIQIYEQYITDAAININIKNDKKRKIIKELMKIEKDLIQDKLNYIKKVIEDMKNDKIKIDDL